MYPWRYFRSCTILKNVRNFRAGTEIYVHYSTKFREVSLPQPGTNTDDGLTKAALLILFGRKPFFSSFNRTRVLFKQRSSFYYSFCPYVCIKTFLSYFGAFKEIVRILFSHSSLLSLCLSVAVLWTVCPIFDIVRIQPRIYAGKYW